MTEQFRTASSIADFRAARQQAALQQVLARLTGRPTELLSYDQVTRQLQTLGSVDRGLQEIPLDAIVGSVGRTNDYTRGFLPRQDSDEDRWARVKQAVTNPLRGGLPPIQVYQVGAAYFVLDGHHRVSVARQSGAKLIEAYVTEVHTRAPLSATPTEAELAARADYVSFLEATELDRRRPGADLSVSAGDQLLTLREQIEAYRQTLADEQGGAVPLPEAAATWYDEVYLPIVQVIREQGMPHAFPSQTEADLYLLVSARCADLEQTLGWEITPEVGALDLATSQKRRRRAAVVRAGARLLSAVVPRDLRPGPSTGGWRRDRVAARYGGERLFADILVPVSGEPAGWTALDEALGLAANEGGRLHGLHVVPTAAAQAGPAAQAVREEFHARCRAAGLTGTLALEVGEVAGTIYRLAALNDLVVLNLAFPPGAKLPARLGSGFRTIILRCPRPVLAVPVATPGPERVVLAFDGSPKAREALFVATYLAETRKTPLFVVTVKQSSVAAAEAVAHARAYLEMHELEAEFIVRDGGTVAEAVLGAVAEYDANLIAIGGYSAHPMVAAMLGGSVDRLLREARVPLLICQ